MSGETRDDHDQESACNAHLSNKDLVRIQQLSSILFAVIRSRNFTAQARSLPTSPECFSENTFSDTFGSAIFSCVFLLRRLFQNSQKRYKNALFT